MRQYVLVVELSGSGDRAALAFGSLDVLKEVAERYRKENQYFWANKWRPFKDLLGRNAWYRDAADIEGVTDEDLFEGDFVTYSIYEVQSE